MRVLVTGGAGFIGCNLIRALLGAGYEVVSVDNFVTGYSENLVSGVENLELDISLASTWEQLPPVDYICHLAAMVSVPESMQKPIQCQRDNVEALLHLVAYARKHKVKKILFASSAATYGDGGSLQSEDQNPRPKSMYGLSKLSGEMILQMCYENDAIPYISYRQFNVFGPYQAVASAYASVIPIFICRGLKNQALKIFGDGEQTRDFIYVDQVVDYYLQGLAHPFCGVMNLGNGQRYSVRQLAQLIQKLLKRDVHLEYCPPRAGDIRASLADISILQKNFAKTSFDFETCLYKTLEFYQAKLSK